MSKCDIERSWAEEMACAGCPASCVADDCPMVEPPSSDTLLAEARLEPYSFMSGTGLSRAASMRASRSSSRIQCLLCSSSAAPLHSTQIASSVPH